MKASILSIAIFFCGQFAVAQNVGIGTITPDASSLLEINSSTKGILVPRLTEAQKDAIANPAQGLLIYNTNSNSFQYFSGTIWNNLTHSGIVNGSPNKVAKFNSPWGITAAGIITDNGAGVGINNSNALASSSAMLDITSTNKGILVPRMSTSQRTAIASPATGLLVFDNATNSFWFYNGSAWVQISSGGNGWASTNNNIYNTNSGNVGIGTTEPYNKLHVNGNLVVSTPTKATSSTPTAAQNKNMVNANTIMFLNTDSTGRVFDPGGPADNYDANINATADIIFTSNPAIELVFESMDLNTGDSLIIKSYGSNSILLAVGNGYSITGKWIFNSSGLRINFKSNADANTGAGFSILFRRLYNNSATLTDVGNYTGNTLFFDTKKGAFRAGVVNNEAIGNFSTAIGNNCTASGIASTAIGDACTASGESSITIGAFSKASGYHSTAIGVGNSATGNNSTAMGYNSEADGTFSTTLGMETDATGNYSTAIGRLTHAAGETSTAMGYFTNANGNASTAMGNNTTASGNNSTAIGFNSVASGETSTAIGWNATASGNYSTAIGNHVSTNNQNGSFVVGDNSTTTVMSSPAINNFRARFANGYRFYTSADYSTSCSLGAGSNAWSTTSDFRLKENFADVNGEDFLQKISTLKLGSWNYKKQDPKTFRHYGPMAQDFYAAFGRDKYGSIGNDTTINSADFAGVSFIAIQALEKRTQKIEETEKKIIKQQATIEELQKQIEELKAIIHQMHNKKNSFSVVKSTGNQE